LAFDFFNDLENRRLAKDLLRWAQESEGSRFCFHAGHKDWKQPCATFAPFNFNVTASTPTCPQIASNENTAASDGSRKLLI
jgi:hypothetical protein